MEINETEYDFSSVLNDVYNMVHIKAQQKALDLIFKIDKELPSAMFGDEMRIRQIMVNILNNAVKYTSEGSVTLCITGSRELESRIILKIDVTDTGIGIREEDMTRLFDKFKRLDIDKNKTVEGSGLGLSITSSLLDLMGGSISVESEYGKGSTFTAMVPQKIVNDTPIGDFKSRLAESLKDRKEYKERFTAPEAEVLVVDDTPMNHVVIRELLKSTEVRIESARSGEECLEKQHKKKYDIILLDYRMPGLDGIETLAEMKKDTESPNRNTPVVVLTANAISGAREHFLREGFDDYLSKPIEGSQLEKMLIRLLPSGKVILSDKEVKELKPGESGTDEEYPKWLKDLERIDAGEGLRNCGSVDSYLSIIKVFYESADMTENNITTAYNDRNIKDYTSFVHSLKSTSRTIGAKELSKLAEKLEMAGNENDLETIEEYHDELMNLFSIVRYSLSKVPEIAEQTAKEEDNDPKEDITDAGMRDAYQTIIEVSKSLDYDTLTFILDSLKKYRLKDEDLKITRKIGEMAYKLQWDEIDNLAVEGLKGVQ